MGLISRSQMLTATERGNARLAEIAGELAETAGKGALAPFTSGQAARAVWDGLDLSRRREVIRTLTPVILHPAGRGARAYDLESKVARYAMLAGRRTSERGPVRPPSQAAGGPRYRPGRDPGSRLLLHHRAGWLREEGFSHAVSERVPGLVIPVRDVHGDLRFSQYRPDKPRMRDGKPAKYELPHRARLVLDVPPAVLTRLGSPARPLWITEGPLKADAAVSAGLDCIAMFGVWGCAGATAGAARPRWPDWEHIALAGRTVYLVPDSDAATNPKVADAIGGSVPCWPAGMPTCGTSTCPLLPMAARPAWMTGWPFTAPMLTGCWPWPPMSPRPVAHARGTGDSRHFWHTPSQGGAGARRPGRAAG